MGTPYSLVSSKMPQQGKKIDGFDKQSNYLVSIVPPVVLAKSLFEYAQNFFKAAHLIAEYVLLAERPDIAKLDTYFFAIAFLYRHCVELGLKAIGFQGIQDKQERENFIQSTRHNLKDILDEAERKNHPIRPDAEMTWLRKFFEDISQTDKESDSFRYPFHIVRKADAMGASRKFDIKPVFEDQTHIDLPKFVNKFEAAFEIIEKWYRRDAGDAAEYAAHAPVFLETGGSYYEQSVVGYRYQPKAFFPYTKAYLETANYLKWYMKEQTDAGAADCKDQLFLPMCYLYRNCAELGLKTVWFEETREDFQDRCKTMLKKKHSIEGMWNKLKPYVAAQNQDPSEAAYLDVIEDYCKQVQQLDADASKFRYPMTKSLQAYFPKPKRFDFLQTGDFLEELNNILDAIDSLLNDVNELENELETAYWNEQDYI